MKIIKTRNGRKIAKAVLYRDLIAKEVRIMTHFYVTFEDSKYSHMYFIGSYRNHHGQHRLVLGNDFLSGYSVDFLQNREEIIEKVRYISKIGNCPEFLRKVLVLMYKQDMKYKEQEEAAELRKMQERIKKEKQEEQYLREEFEMFSLGNRSDLLQQLHKLS